MYPIKQKHLDNFKTQLNRKASYHVGYDLRTSGNWRVIQPYDVQDLKIIGPSMDELMYDALGQPPSWAAFNTLCIIFGIIYLLFW